ncbi:lysine N(6)-hydroxylase/L-ornithine N(5)-oxygenase family protein [Actinacidiphila acididurans]|uniref:L-lysine N6-monooxygenase MbtG n=1 Tax=Actinacidiphila acididurans TaxID=2784346 RepID=A0ABS2TM25_9ACTN|nr:SidA/IucD/PvdA family monooxygenase [Actinacidiphila acididurans]MBM9504117.1 SidA/IucD/PvdA family monooxygenase [Actinacidiphila acididurans]
MPVPHQQTTPDEDEPYDVLGIGFGPANLALAIALEEADPGLRAHFLEGRQDPVWQGGMMLEGSNIQNHPSRDLVTLRNPRSRYSFLNYLYEEDRLLEHLNVAAEFPLRKEYAQYVSWVTRHFDHLVEYGQRVADVEVAEHRGEPVFAVTTEQGARRTGRSLVVGPGRTPYVPAPFDTMSSPRVFHLTQYLYRLRELEQAPARIAVIGGSQSAVELTLDLSRRFPQARVVDLVRSFSLRLKDTSPFSEEGYFPGFTDYYYRASRASKRELDAYMRATNYSSADDDVLKELYLRIYEQRLDGDQKVFVQGNRQVIAAEDDGREVTLRIRETHTGELTEEAFDLVVIATGFRDLGPLPHQEAYPPLLAGVAGRLRFDEDGHLAVNVDYSLESDVPGGMPPLFLNGLCESSHGIGDAGSFSLLSLRADVIRTGLRDRLAARATASVAV